MSSQMYSRRDYDYLRALYQRSAEQPAEEAPTQGIMEGFPPPPELRVRRDNWLEYPYSTWSFRNVTKLFPTVPVYRDPSWASDLDYQPVDLDGLRFKSICGQEVTLAAHLKATHTNGFLVIRNNTILYERHFGQMHGSDRHAWFSVSQILIGLVIEDLVYRQALAPETKVVDILPDLATTAFGQATVANLLDMSVGVDYREDYNDPESHSSHYTYASGLIQRRKGETRAESLHSYLLSLQQNRSHGGFFQYVTANSEVLAWVAETVTGQSFPLLVQRLWRNIGCESDSLFITDAWGRGIAAAGLCSTLLDMGRLGVMLANKGRIGHRAVLPACLIENILGSADASRFQDTPDYSQWLPGAAYKSQFYVLENRVLMGCGIYGQYLYADTRTGTVIAKFSSAGEAADPLDIDTVRLFRLISDFEV